MSWLSKFLICRPQTLPVSMAPVVVAGALSSKLGHFSWLPFLLCLLFAVFAQITANLGRGVGIRPSAYPLSPRWNGG